MSCAAVTGIAVRHVTDRLKGNLRSTLSPYQAHAPALSALQSTFGPCRSGGAAALLPPQLLAVAAAAAVTAGAASRGLPGWQLRHLDNSE